MTATDRATVSRRAFLGGGAATLGGAALGGVAIGRATDAGAATPAVSPPAPGTATAVVDVGADTLPFHGVRQSGVETPAQAFATFLALDLRPDVDREAVGRMLRLLSDDAARLTQGRGALADDEAELAASPARLTVTFGFGPSLFDKLGLQDLRPSGLVEVPPLAIDALEDRWSGGDLLLHLGGDDPMSLAHCLRMVTKDSRAFATTRWVQRGFRHARGATTEQATPRNLMGQVDGSTNPARGTNDFERVVWGVDGPAWFQGGTTMVLRRIRMELDTWDQVARGERELVVGRRLGTGAPLTGGTERDGVDLRAVGADGLTVVPEFAHVARAHARTGDERFLRRGYSYDDPSHDDAGGTTTESGLLFCAYQADIGRQLVPVQQRLAEADALNEWTTPVGSAVFAIPPGCGPDGWVGEGLLA